MTKILFVTGGDYSASEFERKLEQSTATVEDFWNAAQTDGGFIEFEDDSGYFEFTALEFGDVDPRFIRWVQSEQDYDESKHRRFFVVEAQ